MPQPGLEIIESPNLSALALRAGQLLEASDLELKDRFNELDTESTALEMIQAQSEMTKNSVISSVLSGCIKERGDCLKGVASKFN